MKRGVLLIIALVLVSVAYAQQCDYDPLCSPNVQSCGCGGLQTRYTLCEGGCSDWYPCNVSDTEAICDDTIDNDCDDLIDCADNDCNQELFCIDEDKDNYPLSVDCDDTNNNINPDAEELCNNIDDNCNNEVDEALEQQCGASDIGECAFGTETCMQGIWQGCNAILPQDEICDSLDNNCDGTIDEGCPEEPSPEPEPAQQISEPQAPEPVLIAEEPAPQPTPEPIEEERVVAIRECMDSDGDGFGIDCPQGFDCNDNDASINPKATEVCNNKDDNCNNRVDEQITRQCGTSNTGKCTLGTEQCTNGAWTGCTAVLPSDEVCENNIDDNCDGRIDEDCDVVISDEETALQKVLTTKFGRGNYNLDEYLEKHRKTKNFITVTKSSKIIKGKTEIKIEINPIQTLYNLTVFESIPKTIASSIDNIIFSMPPEIIQADPLFAWHFDELSEKTDLSYEIPGEIEDAAEKTETVTFAEHSTPIVRPWYFDLVPLLIIPVLGFMFIFFVELVHQKKK
jgi:hypothetical protein